jgi:hypothetical protein
VQLVEKPSNVLQPKTDARRKLKSKFNLNLFLLDKKQQTFTR